MKNLFYLSAAMFFCVNIFAQNTSIPPNTAVKPAIKPWLLTGNSGTKPSINFLGTKDVQPLMFRVNNQQSGNIDYDFSTANTGFGYQSLKANTSVNNTAFGYNTLSVNTGGQYNVAVGSFNLFANTTGLGNTAVGAVALVGNTTGSFNTGIGENALIGNTTGESNTGVGNQTLLQNKTGQNNVAVGSLALYFTTGSFNTALGSNSLYGNSSGHDNTAVGLYSLYRNFDGNNNTADGSGAMFNNLDGSNNTALGNSALYLPLHGNNSTAIGYNANMAFDNLTNATVIGYNAIVDASNKVCIGNTAVTSIGGQVSWTNLSDVRVKKDVKANVPGLAFIKALRPVTYHFDIEKENELLSAKQEKVIGNIENINFTGLIAQEVDAAAKKINYDFSGVDKTGKLWGLRYADFVVPVIKALQELNDSLVTISTNQQQQIKDLQSRLDKIEQTLNQSVAGANLSTSSSLSALSKFSFYPNPASSVIHVKVDGKRTVVISDEAGKIYISKVINGAGDIIVSALQQGVYFISDGSDEVGKKMIIQK